MKVFDHIALIYNPKSTGDAPKMAKDLADSINGHYEIIQKKAILYPTKRQGHAVEISSDIASKYARPLIISISGDGGYNEVINGVMEARKLFPAQRPVLAVMAAGNANDHKRVVRGDTPLIRLIKSPKTAPIDIISLSAKSSDFHLLRYAHSYIGFGLTPSVGHEINQHSKSRWNEIRLTLRTVGKFKPISIIRNNKTSRIDSIIFANINEMAKVVKLDNKKSIQDGRFEVVVVNHRGKLRLITSLLSALIHGFSKQPSYSSYSFHTLETQPAQLDGEIEELSPESDIVIRSHRHAIETLV